VRSCAVASPGTSPELRQALEARLEAADEEFRYAKARMRSGASTLLVVAVLVGVEAAAEGAIATTFDFATLAEKQSKCCYPTSSTYPSRLAESSPLLDWPEIPPRDGLRPKEEMLGVPSSASRQDREARRGRFHGEAESRSGHEPKVCGARRGGARLRPLRSLLKRL